ncbi:MAG: hypothetical protein DWQ36_02365 [Acidobacteria bacterium]|nr:MAG: hypothetical protein DWQ30_23755 [Acidobacteriota bacterium]REK11287.1 MAG: hypothetical protein DWQ36_02365 [Acidobacteriota bacterium]
MRSGMNSLRNRVIDGQKRVLDFQRSTFDRTYDAVISFAEKREDALSDWMKNNERVPAELRDTYAAWVWATRTGRSSYREAVIKTFDLAEQWTEGQRASA